MLNDLSPSLPPHRLPSGVRGRRYLALCLAGGWIHGAWGSSTVMAGDPPASCPGKSWEWLADEEAAAQDWSREKLEAARENAAKLQSDALWKDLLHHIGVP